MKLNVYVLDYDPIKCAAMHQDIDIAPQIQTIIKILQAVNAKKHPLKNYVLTKWAMTAPHFWYLKKLGLSLIKEQEYRFGQHNAYALDALHLVGEMKSEKIAVRFMQLVPTVIPGDPVTAYRQFYMNTNSGASWTKRGAPEWWKSTEQRTLDL